MSDGSARQPVRRPSLADAIVPPALLACLIAGALALFGLDALDGPIQAALILCCMVTALIALKNNLASPVLSVAYGFTGFKIEYIEPVTEVSPSKDPLADRTTEDDGGADGRH